MGRTRHHSKASFHEHVRLHKTNNNNKYSTSSSSPKIHRLRKKIKNHEVFGATLLHTVERQEQKLEEQTGIIRNQRKEIEAGEEGVAILAEFAGQDYTEVKELSKQVDDLEMMVWCKDRTIEDLQNQLLTKSAEVRSYFSLRRKVELQVQSLNR